MIPEIARKIIILTLVLLIIKRLIKIKNREHFRQTTTDFTPSFRGIQPVCIYVASAP